MNPERWQRVQRIFHGALERDPAARDAYLHEACEGDAELEREVRALIEQDAAESSPLEEGVGLLAHAVFEGSGNVPERIGPYRILELLGEGGMGVVYKAQRDDLETVVAIKFLRDARLSPERRERFLQEQRMLGRLSHPSICALHDAGVLADGTPYFVMEHVDGLPVTRFCEQYGLGLPERLRLLREVADAVGHAHRQMLIHRDIKPSNILAVRHGEDEPATIKLLDFGIAKQTEEADEQPATRSMFRLLTPAYAAPEQLAGLHPGTFTDVYSLGVVLYELLTGDLPFKHEVREHAPERPSLRARSSHRAPAFVPSVRRRAWADLDVLCLTAMHADPDRRYRTVDAFVADLDHFLADEPLVARPDSVGYRLGKFVARNRRAVGTAAIGALVIAGLLVFYTYRLSKARDAAIAEAERTQRVQQFTLNLFQGGDDVAGPRQGLDVLTLIERGVREAQALDGQPEIQAELLQNLGGVYQQLGELDRAEALTRTALDQRVAHLGEGHSDSVESMTALGEIAADRGDLDEAERLIRRALDSAEANLDRRDPRVSAAHEALGVLLTQRSSYDEAFGSLHTAIALREAAGDATALRESLGSLANAYFYVGDYERSDEVNRRLRTMIGEALGEEHPSYATCLVNLASSRKWLGYAEEAEELYAKALEINEAYYGRNHPTVVSNLSLLGDALVAEGRHDEATTMLEEALAATEQIYGADHPEVALVLNKMAPIAMARDDLAAAEAIHVRELEIYRNTYGEEHVRTAAGWSNLASMQYRRKRLAEAERSMRRAVATFAAALKPDHVDLAKARVKLGQLLVARERYEPAIEELNTGLAALEAQTNPESAWITAARDGLADARAALDEK